MMLLTFILATVNLTDMMSPSDMRTTGVASLTSAQKQALEAWIDNKFVLKSQATATGPLSLQQNIQGGTQLMLSDGSVYEIAPADRSKAMFWLTPINVILEQSSDPNYPMKITNTLTNVSVNGKKIK
jgi:hypothetical protein